MPWLQYSSLVVSPPSLESSACTSCLTLIKRSRILFSQTWLVCRSEVHYLSIPLTWRLGYYAPPFYWSIIETNTGILSACLPTLRPLFKAYPLGSSFSKLIKSLSGGFRSTLRPSVDVRLNSMEHGLTEAESKALNVHQNKAYAVYDNTKPTYASNTGITYESTYTVSDQSRTRLSQ